MPYNDRERSMRQHVGLDSVPPEIFSSTDVQKMMDNKFIVVIGDSIQRGVYKDLVVLLQSDRRLKPYELRQKGEKSTAGDYLVQRSDLTNGKSYREVREYRSKDGRHLVRFYFVTRCYSVFMETVMADLSQNPKPDVVIMNSCLWDISRYGSTSMDSFQVNLQKAVQRFQQVLTPECLFIWNTTLPISAHIRGGFLLPDVAFMAAILRRDVLEANYYCQMVVADHGFDVLDLHYYFRNQIQHRRDDGVHWDEIVHRRITNLLLSHMCEAWGIGLPPKRGYSSSSSSRYRQVEVVSGRDSESRQSRMTADEQRYRPGQRVRSATCHPSYLGRGTERVHEQPCARSREMVDLMQRDVVQQQRMAMREASPHQVHNQYHHQQPQQQQDYNPYQYHLQQQQQQQQKQQNGGWAGSLAATIMFAGAVSQMKEGYRQDNLMGAVHRQPSYHRHYKPWN